MPTAVGETASGIALSHTKEARRRPRPLPECRLLLDALPEPMSEYV